MEDAREGERADGISGVELESGDGRAPLSVVAIEKYTPVRPRELGFEEGEKITVTKMEGDDWLEGRIGFKRKGWFPRRCVKVVFYRQADQLTSPAEMPFPANAAGDSLPALPLVQSDTPTSDHRGVRRIGKKIMAIGRKKDDHAPFLTPIFGKGARDEFWESPEKQDLIVRLTRFLRQRPSAEQLRSLKILIDQPVFGVPLRDALVAFSLEQREVPTIVRRCTEFLSHKRALHKEGLFRTVPGASELEHLRRESDLAFGNVEFGKNTTVDAVASLLKAYLRELPEPPLTYALYDSFIFAAGCETRTQRIHAIRDAVAQLPENNRALVEHLLRFLRKVCEHTKENKMTPHNLAICLNPSFMRARRGYMSTFDMFDQQEAPQTLLNEPDEPFVSDCCAPLPNNVTRRDVRLAYAKAAFAARDRKFELSFKKEDPVFILHADDEHPDVWWHGELEGKRGLVPANHFEFYEHPSPFSYFGRLEDLLSAFQGTTAQLERYLDLRRKAEFTADGALPQRDASVAQDEIQALGQLDRSLRHVCDLTGLVLPHLGAPQPDSSSFRLDSFSAAANGTSGDEPSAAAGTEVHARTTSGAIRDARRIAGESDRAQYTPRKRLDVMDAPPPREPPQPIRQERLEKPEKPEKPEIPEKPEKPGHLERPDKLLSPAGNGDASQARVGALDGTSTAGTGSTAGSLVVERSDDEPRNGDDQHKPKTPSVGVGEQGHYYDFMRFMGVSDGSDGLTADEAAEKMRGEYRVGFRDDSAGSSAAAAPTVRSPRSPVGSPSGRERAPGKRVMRSMTLPNLNRDEQQRAMASAGLPPPQRAPPSPPVQSPAHAGGLPPLGLGLTPNASVRQRELQQRAMLAPSHSAPRVASLPGDGSRQ